MTETIRLATHDDVGAIATCAADAYAIYVERIGRKPAPMIANFGSLVADDVVHVLEVSGAVAGFVIFYPRDDHMHLENVAVASTFQGYGYGGRLLEFVEQEARRAEIDRVELYTNIHMTENIPYYLSRGYTETGRRNEDGFDRVFFCKILEA